MKRPQPHRFPPVPCGPQDRFTTPHVRDALKAAAGALAVAARGATVAEGQVLLKLAAALTPDEAFVTEAAVLARGRAWDLVKGQLFVASTSQRKRLVELGEDPDGGLPAQDQRTGNGGRPS